VYSYFIPLKQPGAFRSACRQEGAGRRCLAAGAQDAGGFHRPGPYREGAARRQTEHRRRFPLRIDSNSKILGYLSVIGFYDLPLTYLDDFTDRIEQVSVAQIREPLRAISTRRRWPR